MFRSRGFALFGLCIALSLFLMGMPAKPVYAIGISPPTVKVNDILHNTEQIRFVTLSRFPNETGDVHLHVSATGTGADFLVGGEQDFFIPSGKDQAVFTFKVNPKNAADGAYEMDLNFLKLLPESSDKKANVSIMTGVTVRVMITVSGEQHLSYKLVAAEIQDSETNAPISLTYVVDNIGNVDWNPEKIVFDFKITEDKTVAMSKTFEAKDLHTILAGVHNQHEKLLISHTLPEGDYDVTATFFDKGASVGSVNSSHVFHVYPADTFKQNGDLQSVEPNKTVFTTGEKIQIDSLFKNTGEVAVKAITIVTLKKGNTVLDLSRGAQYDVAPQDSSRTTTFFDTKGSGTYTIEAYTEYGSKRTPLKFVTIKVNQTSLMIMTETGIAMLLISIGGFLLARKVKKTHKASVKTKPKKKTTKRS